MFRTATRNHASIFKLNQSFPRPKSFSLKQSRFFAAFPKASSLHPLSTTFVADQNRKKIPLDILVTAAATTVLFSTVHADAAPLDKLESVAQKLNVTLPKKTLDETYEAYEKRCKKFCYDRIFEACLDGRWDLLDRLDKAFLDEVTLYGKSLLLIAAQEGSERLVEELMRRKIALEVTDSVGNTPLHLAVANGLSSPISQLRRYVRVENTLGESPFHTAIKTGQSHLIHPLLQEGADEAKTCIYGKVRLSPLALAVASGEVSSFDQLIRSLNHVDFNTVTPGIGNLLHVALHFNQLEMFKHLLTTYHAQTEGLIEGAPYGKTPLELACAKGFLDEVSFLIRDKKAAAGQAAHIAAQNEQMDVLELLGYLGVNLVSQHEGKRPEDYLKEDQKLRLAAVVAKQDRHDTSPPNFVYQPPENLVLQGGGPKGLVEVGAISELEEKGALRNLRYVAGTSAGAITAAFLAVCYTAEEIEKISLDFDLKTLLDPTKENERKLNALLEASKKEGTQSKLTHVLKELVNETLGDLLSFKSPEQILRKFSKLEGLCTGQTFLDWMEEKIAAKTGCQHCTFGELRALIESGGNFRHLHVYVTQIEDELKPICINSSDKRWDNVIISDAIRASMSIPGIFKPHQLYYKDPNTGKRDARAHGPKLVDGGLLRNFPLDAFDHINYQKNARSNQAWNTETANRKTLGLAISKGEEGGEQKVEGVIDLLSALANIFFSAERILQEEKTYNQYRVITLSPQDATLFSFDLSHEKKVALIESGKETVKHHPFFAPTLGSALTPAEKPHTNLSHHDLSTFVGREQLLRRLRHQCTGKDVHTKTQVYVLWGLPGMGKTQTALHFANSNRHHFSQVWRINCRTELSRNQSYREIAEKLRIQVFEKTPIEEIQRLVHRRLEEAQKPWLLILDNVESQLDPKTDFPQKGGYVIATTTKKNVWPHPGEVEKVGALSEDEAIDLLQQTTHEEPSEQMKQLAHDLGYFPLALKLAGNYIGSTSTVDIAGYVRAYGANPTEAPMEEDRFHEQTLKRVWDITLQTVKKESPQAAEWLNICAFLAPDQIPVSWLDRWGEDIGKVEVMHIRHLLEKYAIIGGDSQTFNMHGLMQKIIQGGLKNKEKMYRQAAELVEKECEQFDIEAPKTWGLAKQWLKQAEYVLSHPLAKELDLQMQLEMYNVIGNIYYSIEGNARNALSANRKSLSLVRKIYPDQNHPESIRALINVSTSLLDLGDYKEAKHFCEQALNMSRALHSNQNHPLLANALDTMAGVLTHLNHNEEALTYSMDALEMLRVLHQSLPHPNLASSLNSVGYILHSLNRDDEAVNFCKQALEMYQKIFPNQNHPSVSLCLNNIAALFSDMGLFQEALDYEEQALKIYRAIYSNQNHPHIAISLHNMSSFLVKLGRFSEALDFGEKALKMSQALYSNQQHSIVIESLLTIINALHHLHCYEEAYEHSKQALEISHMIYSDQMHAVTAASLSSLGVSLEKLGRYEEALDFGKQALEMRKALYQNRSHTGLARSSNNVGMALYKLKRYEEALQHLEEAQRMQKVVLPKNHPHIRETEANIAEVKKAMSSWCPMM